MKVIEAGEKFVTDENRKRFHAEFQQTSQLLVMCMQITLCGIKDWVYGKQKLIEGIHGHTYTQTYRQEGYRISLL
jgi:hypothetical protein